METIYLDNAATSFPKPQEVASQINYYLCNVGATINRSVYDSAASAGLVTYTLRERLCRIFNFNDPSHVILTSGNTMGLNMIIKGYLKPGDHCLVSSMEHNAVMRPLQQLKNQNITFDRIPCNSDGIIDIKKLPSLIKKETRLVIISHASNVGGGIQDIYALGNICKEYGIPFALDAAQTAGHLPIDFEAAGLSALSAPGHKGLMGPSGIGVLLLKPDFAKKMTPIITGGTGSASDSEIQPNYMPDRFESGTSNLPGIYGLEAALSYIEKIGIDRIRLHDEEMTSYFINEIKKIPNIYLAGPTETKNRVGVISIDFINKDNAECSYRLESEYGILTRCGLHCAPSAHKTFNTFPQGTVRFSLGWFNTKKDVDNAITAIREISLE